MDASLSLVPPLWHAKKSKLLLALDDVLDADELDVIAAEIEDDMEADEDEDDEEEMVEGR